MEISELRQLVWRYASGALDLDEFRSEFVCSFLAVRHADDLDDLVNRIESQCADFSEGEIGEGLLRHRLVSILVPKAVIVRVELTDLSIVPSDQGIQILGSGTNTSTDSFPLPVESFTSSPSPWVDFELASA